MLKLNTHGDASQPAVLRARFAAAVGTLIWLMAPSIAGAQNIVKRVDAQGRVHFSDHAPSGQDTETVAVHVSRSHAAPTPPAAMSSAIVTRSSSAAAPTASPNSAAAREAEQQQRWAEQREAAEAAKAQADKDLVAKCNQAHEIYCNQGADTIRQRDTTRAAIQYGDAISARQDRISRGLRPGALPPAP